MLQSCRSLPGLNRFQAGIKLGLDQGHNTALPERHFMMLSAFMAEYIPWRIQRGFRGFAQTPTPSPFFKYPMNMKQFGKLISFSWDI